MKRLLLLLPFALSACDSPVTEPSAKPLPSVAFAFVPDPTCLLTTFVRDGNPLTARLINPVGTVSGPVLGGCDIGVYYSSGATGTVNGATISGDRYFGLLNDGATVDVINSSISNIGESPLDGSQHGVAITFTTIHVQGGSPVGSASGTISGNTISQYQKGGITVSGDGAFANVLNNSVTGLGPIDFIAQNGIQISFGASAVVRGNTVSGNDYTPKNTIACGILLFDANGVSDSQNKYRDNERNNCNFGKGGGNVNP